MMDFGYTYRWMLPGLLALGCGLFATAAAAAESCVTSPAETQNAAATPAKWMAEAGCSFFGRRDQEAVLIGNDFSGNQSEKRGGGAYIDAKLANMGNSFDQSPVTGFRTGLPILIDPSIRDGLDPLFAEAELHLSADSPMIDSGDANAPRLPARDMDGEPRIAGTTVDIGADERVPEDFDGVP